MLPMCHKLRVSKSLYARHKDKYWDYKHEIKSNETTLGESKN